MTQIIILDIEMLSTLANCKRDVVLLVLETWANLISFKTMLLDYENALIHTMKFRRYNFDIAYSEELYHDSVNFYFNHVRFMLSKYEDSEIYYVSFIIVDSDTVLLELTTPT